MRNTTRAPAAKLAVARAGQGRAPRQDARDRKFPAQIHGDIVGVERGSPEPRRAALRGDVRSGRLRPRRSNGGIDMQKSVIHRATFRATSLQLGIGGLAAVLVMSATPAFAADPAPATGSAPASGSPPGAAVPPGGPHDPKLRPGPTSPGETAPYIIPAAREAQVKRLVAPHALGKVIAGDTKLANITVKHDRIVLELGSPDNAVEIVHGKVAAATDVKAGLVALRAPPSVPKPVVDALVATLSKRTLAELPWIEKVKDPPKQAIVPPANPPKPASAPAAVMPPTTSVAVALATPSAAQPAPAAGDESKRTLWTTVGLTAGGALLLLIVIIVIARRKRPPTRL